MAVVRLILAAEKAAAIKLLPINILNVTFGHQIKKLVLVNVPCATILLILVQDILSRCQFGYMLIAQATDLLCEISQIVSFCKTSELRNIVEANINKLLDPRLH